MISSGAFYIIQNPFSLLPLPLDVPDGNDLFFFSEQVFEALIANRDAVEAVVDLRLFMGNSPIQRMCKSGGGKSQY